MDDFDPNLLDPTPSEPAPQNPSDPSPQADPQPVAEMSLANLKLDPIPNNDELGRAPAPRKPAPETPAPGNQDNEPGPKHLRDEYRKTREELASEKARILEIETQKKLVEEEKQKLAEQLRTIQERASEQDPSQHPEIQQLHSSIDQEFKALPTQLMMSRDEVKSMARVPELLAKFRNVGSPEQDGYDERRDDYLSSVRQSFPEHHTEIKNFISKAAQQYDTIEKKLHEIKETGGLRSFERVRQEYDSLAKEYSNEEQSFFAIDEATRELPYHPKTILSNLIETAPKVKEVADKIKADVRKFLLPLAPLDPKELENLDPKARDEMLKTREQQHRNHSRQIGSQIPAALLALQVLPGIMKRLAELETKNRSKLDSQPQPRGPGEQEKPSNEPETINLKELKLPPIPNRF